jgi:hypothetical protein
MKKEDLLQYIRQPQAISPDQALEIKKLARIYPYFQALYLLLAKASPSEATFRQAAVHTLDRGLLRRLVGNDTAQAVDLQGFQIDTDSPDLLAKLGAAEAGQVPATDLGLANLDAPFGQEPPAFIDQPGDEEDSWLKEFDRRFDQGDTVELDLSADLAKSPVPEPPTLPDDGDNFVFQKFHEQPDFGDVESLLNDPDYLKLKEQPADSGLDLGGLYGDDDLLPPVSDDEIFGSSTGPLPKPSEVVLEIAPSAQEIDQPVQVAAAELTPPVENVPTWLAETANSDIGDSFFDKLIDENPVTPLPEPKLVGEPPLAGGTAESTDLPTALVAELGQPSDDQPAFDDLQATSFFSGEAWDSPAETTGPPSQLAAEPPAIVDLDSDGDIDWDDVHALRKAEEGQWYENQPAESWLDELAAPLVDADQDGDIDWDDVHSIRKDEEARWLDQNPAGLAELEAGLQEEVPTDLPEAHPLALVHEYADRKAEEADYWQQADQTANNETTHGHDHPTAQAPEVASYQTRSLDSELPPPVSSVAPVPPVGAEKGSAEESDNFFDSLVVPEPPAAPVQAATEDFVGDDLSFFEQTTPKSEPATPAPAPVSDQWQIVDDFIKKEPRINIDRTKTQNEDDLPDLSEPSVQWNVEVASETLAKIYAEQGRFAKVADIYRKLAQNYPEKRDEYLAKIASLPL